MRNSKLGLELRHSNHKVGGRLIVSGALRIENRATCIISVNPDFANPSHLAVRISHFAFRISSLTLDLSSPLPASFRSPNSIGSSSNCRSPHCAGLHCSTPRRKSSPQRSTTPDEPGSLPPACFGRHAPQGSLHQPWWTE